MSSHIQLNELKPKELKMLEKIRYQQDHLTPTVSLPINFILTYMLIDRIYWIWERLPEIRSKIRLDKTFSVSESTTLLLDIGTDPHAETSVHI